MTILSQIVHSVKGVIDRGCFLDKVIFDKGCFLLFWIDGYSLLKGASTHVSWGGGCSFCDTMYEDLSKTIILGGQKSPNLHDVING